MNVSDKFHVPFILPMTGNLFWQRLTGDAVYKVGEEVLVEGGERYRICVLESSDPRHDGLATRLLYPAQELEW